VVVAAPAAPVSKKLAYDIVRAGHLSESDWNVVGKGIATDLGLAYHQEAVVAALGTLPYVPPHKLASFLAADGDPPPSPSAPNPNQPSLPQALHSLVSPGESWIGKHAPGDCSCFVELSDSKIGLSYQIPKGRGNLEGRLLALRG
jgi:hypothetical protein